MIGIYKYENKINGKIYIGQSKNIEYRYNEHLNGWKVDRPQHIDLAIHKYGIDNFNFDIIQQFDELDTDKLNQAEVYWVQYYDCYNTSHGYNHRAPGDSMIMDEYTRYKIALKSQGESNPMYGKTHTVEARAKISETQLARSEEIIKINKETKSKKCKCIELDKIFNSTRDAAAWLRDNGYPKASHAPIGKNCRGVRYNIAYGYHWEYVE